jgi:hypothetical protein
LYELSPFGVLSFGFFSIAIGFDDGGVDLLNFASESDLLGFASVPALESISITGHMIETEKEHASASSPHPKLKIKHPAEKKSVECYYCRLLSWTRSSLTLSEVKINSGEILKGINVFE